MLFRLGNYLGDVIYFTILAFLWTYTYLGGGDNRWHSCNQDLCRILDLAAIVFHFCQNQFLNWHSYFLLLKYTFENQMQIFVKELSNKWLLYKLKILIQKTITWHKELGIIIKKSGNDSVEREWNQHFLVFEVCQVLITRDLISSLNHPCFQSSHTHAQTEPHSVSETVNLWLQSSVFSHRSMWISCLLFFEKSSCIILWWLSLSENLLNRNECFWTPLNFISCFSYFQSLLC